MSKQRVYKSSDYMQVSVGEPIRSVVAESEHAVIVAWHVEPGQTIAPHTHPDGQDSWTILSGQGQYQTDTQGSSMSLCAPAANRCASSRWWRRWTRAMCHRAAPAAL